MMNVGPTRSIPGNSRTAARHRQGQLGDQVTGTFTCRARCNDDDAALRTLMRAQMEYDPGWPPDYAKSMDLAEWLRRPASLGQWVAVDGDGTLVGHVGLGAVRPGPIADLLCAQLPCPCDSMAEICRIVVHPEARRHGLAGLLTRKAMRTSIEAGMLPIATVLENRDSWLSMMLSTGWCSAGTVESRVPDVGLHVLLPPRKFIALVLGPEHG